MLKVPLMNLSGYGNFDFNPDQKVVKELSDKVCSLYMAAEQIYNEVIKVLKIKARQGGRLFHYATGYRSGFHYAVSLLTQRQSDLR